MNVLNLIIIFLINLDILLKLIILTYKRCYMVLFIGHNMLEAIFGSTNKERILLYLVARGDGYAREIAKHFNTGLSPIQKQLENLEASSVLYSKSVGRTRVFSLNPRYPFISELRNLLEKALQFLPEAEKDDLLNVRKRPRRKGKPL